MCFRDPKCHLIMAQAMQAAKLYHLEITDLGEALSKALGTTLKGVFKPSHLFGENRMILDQDEEEIKL